MPLGLLWFAIAVMILPVRCLLTGARSCMRRGWIGVDSGLWKFHAHSGQRLCTRFRSVGTESANIDANRNFITNIIDDDLTTGATGRRVVTRFPPEPNGYLHLGHAKSINLNFAVAKAYGGVTHMRFDDTNPAKEDIEYVRSILDDVRWLVTGKLQPEEDPWFGPVRHASSYFRTIYESAEYLITKGLAYVDEQSADELKARRGTLTEPGQNSPYRDRPVEENMRLFRSMKAGHFPDGHCVLRAKIHMSSPNMNLRDPTLYRIKKEPHPMTGNAWCIYPMYDFAHAISDALEGITHSLCTLEFENHRPLYDWIVDNLMPSGLLPYQKEGWRPRQYEFSRLNLQYTVLSKRKLIALVTGKHVSGWDDPRLPTISGLRRRGFPAAAVRLFADRVGISKVENNIDVAVLEDCAREVLEVEAPRLFAVPHPLKVKITNWNREDSEIFSVERHPKQADLGHRDLPFSGELFIDRDDFFDTKSDVAGMAPLAPPKGYKRLLPGGQVRLKNAYVITCDKVIRDASGAVCELHCSYDPATRSGQTPAGAAKVKGIVQWVDAATAVPADLFLYDRLFLQPTPGKDQPDGDFLRDLNPHSLEVVRGAAVESSVLQSLRDYRSTASTSNSGGVARGTFQFERVGYFALDGTGPVQGESTTGSAPLRFNRIVTLKDTWQNAFAEDGKSTQTAPPARFVAAQSDTAGASAASAQSPVVEDVRRVELRVGQILSAQLHPDADSLYVLQVRVGDDAQTVPAGSNLPEDGAPCGPVRTIISGLAGRIPIADLPNKKVVVVCNLKPSKMRGIVSEGMLLAASSDEKVELLAPPEDAPLGELIQVKGYDAPVPDRVLKSKSAQDAWKRVVSELGTNSLGEACYGKEGAPKSTTGGMASPPYMQAKLIAEDEAVVNHETEEEEEYFMLRESESICAVKPYDIASTLHVHHIETTRQCVRFIAKLILGYMDFITDVICVVFFYNPNKAFPTAFALAVTAISLPTVIMISLPRQDCQSRMLTLCRCRLTYEAIKSWQNHLETTQFCLIELIESVGGGFPSALIQLYAVMYRTAYDSDNEFRLLGPEYVLYISIGLSVLASSWTSTRLFTTNEERHCSKAFYVLLFVYYASEKLYRMFYFSVISLFLSSGGYRHGRNPYMLNAIFLGVSVLTRCAVVRYSHQRVAPQPSTWEEMWDFVGRLLLSLATSHMWVGEYVLSCRFLMLEFLELAFYIPFFMWLRRVTNYEQNHFNARIPIALTMYFYAFKMILLVGRLYFTPHARHVLYNHATILMSEAIVVLLCVLGIWAALIIITFTT